MTEKKTAATKKPRQSRAKQAADVARKIAPKKPATVAAGTPADKPGATELYFQNGPEAPYAYHLGTYDTTAEAVADGDLLLPRLSTQDEDGNDRGVYWVGAENAPDWVAEEIRPYA